MNNNEPQELFIDMKQSLVYRYIKSIKLIELLQEEFTKELEKNKNFY